MNVPGRDTVVGIDVSRWQGSIDWDLVAPTISFAFLKSTGGDGGLYRDPSFTRNAAEATRVGVPWGAYHFASRMTFDAVTEARYFCDQVRGTGWTLPPVLDWEPLGVNGTQALGWVLAFCAEVERQLGVRPIIYTGAYVSLDRGDALKDYDLWLAAYTPQPIRCAPWDTWTIWQYTSMARLPGITANTVDMNLADRAWLERFTTQPINDEEGELMAAIDEIRTEFVNQDTRTRVLLLACFDAQLNHLHATVDMATARLADLIRASNSGAAGADVELRDGLTKLLADLEAAPRPTMAELVPEDV